MVAASSKEAILPEENARLTLEETESFNLSSAHISWNGSSFNNVGDPMAVGVECSRGLEIFDWEAPIRSWNKKNIPVQEEDVSD